MFFRVCCLIKINVPLDIISECEQSAFFQISLWLTDNCHDAADRQGRYTYKHGVQPLDRPPWPPLPLLRMSVGWQSLCHVDRWCYRGHWHSHSNRNSHPARWSRTCIGLWIDIKTVIFHAQTTAYTHLWAYIKPVTFHVETAGTGLWADINTAAVMLKQWVLACEQTLNQSSVMLKQWVLACEQTLNKSSVMLKQWVLACK